MTKHRACRFDLSVCLSNLFGVVFLRGRDVDLVGRFYLVSPFFDQIDSASRAIVTDVDVLFARKVALEGIDLILLIVPEC